MVEFDIYNTVVPLCGGLIIAISTSLNLLIKGRLTGLSSIINGVITCDKDTIRWKSSFIAGLIAVGVICWDIWGWQPAQGITIFDRPFYFVRGLDMWGWILSGFLVGIGSKIANGCTSGHGVCGVPRWSKRSIVAVICFMGAAFAMATIRYHYPFFTNTIWGEEAVKAPVQIVANVFLGLSGLLILFFLFKRSDFPMGSVELADTLVGFFCGALFGVGVLVAGLTRRSRILGFLTLSENWDPSLLFVFIGAMGANIITFHFILKRTLPMAALSWDFDKDNTAEVDFKVVFGSILFGAGWGLGGICTAPALIAMTLYLPHVLLFFITSLVIGQWIGGVIVGDKSTAGYQTIKSD